MLGFSFGDSMFWNCITTYVKIPVVTVAKKTITPVYHVIRHVGKAFRYKLRHGSLNMSHHGAHFVWKAVLSCALVGGVGGVVGTVLPGTNGIIGGGLPQYGQEYSPPAIDSETLPINVPEPSSMIVFAVGVVGTLFLRNRRY